MFCIQFCIEDPTEMVPLYPTVDVRTSVPMRLQWEQCWSSLRVAAVAWRRLCSTANSIATTAQQGKRYCQLLLCSVVPQVAKFFRCCSTWGQRVRRPAPSLDTNTISWYLQSLPFGLDIRSGTQPGYKLKVEILFSVGDGRAHSPGYSAKYDSHSIIELEVNCVIDVQLVQLTYAYVDNPMSCVLALASQQKDVDVFELQEEPHPLQDFFDKPDKKEAVKVCASRCKSQALVGKIVCAYLLNRLYE